MRNQRIVFVFCVTFFLNFAGSYHAYAVLPDEILQDTVLEQRARALSTQLRCLVCQNETIDDSNAPLARDLRILLRERLTAGDSDKEILAYLTLRYGEFILLKPPLTSATFLLWSTPIFIILMALIVILWRIKRKKKQKTLPLTAEEKEKLAKILHENA